MGPQKTNPDLKSPPSEGGVASCVDRVRDSVKGLAEICPPLAQLIFESMNRIKVAEGEYLHMLEEATLVSRRRAAQMLDMSEDSLDRHVATGRLQAKYADSRPRFELTEIRRFIRALPNKHRGSRQTKK